MSPDPYGQFWSPYLAMANNPVSMTDPDGGCTGIDCIGAATMALADAAACTATGISAKAATSMLATTAAAAARGSGGYEIEFNLTYPTGDLGMNNSYSPRTYSSYTPSYQVTDTSPLTNISQPSFSMPSAETMQTVMSVAGWVPGLQTVAGIAEAGIALYRGDYGGAALAALGAIPVAGYLVKSARAARSLYKIKGVYDITVTGARFNGRYVGESVDIVRRLRQHTGLFGKFRGHKIQINEVYSMPGSSSRYREIFEQQILNTRGGPNAPGVLNKINPHKPSAGLILF